MPPQSHQSRLAGAGAWVDPAKLPKHGDTASIAGNASDEIKQLTSNTLWSYGVGEENGFGYNACQRLKVVEVNIDSCDGRTTATVLHEIEVFDGMLNGAGVVHGGCFCTLIDLCASTPLVALGLAQGINGVGVAQSMAIVYHAPALMGNCLRLVGTTVALSKRVMTARCEITEKTSGRVLATAVLTKMQPRL